MSARAIACFEEERGYKHKEQAIKGKALSFPLLLLVEIVVFISWWL